MFESYRGNFPEGNSQSNRLQLIQEYFQQRSCRHCCNNYSADGIELVREEPGMVVVRVACLRCGQPLGIALVGIAKSEINTSLNSEKNTCLTSSHSKKSNCPAYPSDWTKSDINRLSELDKISYDDVLDAHLFFNSLSEDWQKYLPKATKTRRVVKNIL